MTAIVINIAGDYDGRDIERARKALGDLGDAANNNAFVAFGEKLKGIGTSISKVGKTMSTNVTLPIVGLGIAAGVAFNQVDEGMDTVAARSGVTGDALVGLQDTFKKVAATATQDMATVGETVGGLAGRFELTGKPLERLSNQMLDLARVTGTDVATTTDTVSKAITGFGLDASRAGGFLDTLLVASQKSGVGIETVAGIAAAAAPTFTTYGLGAKDSVGLIAALSEAGIPATRVVGGLNAAFKKLTEAGVKDLPAGLQAVFEKIRDAKDPTKATALAVETFGSRVGVTLAEAIRSGKIDINDLSASLDGAAGALGRTAQAVEGPQEQFARIKNQLMLVGASIAETVIPVIESLVPYIQKAVDWFMALDPSVKQIIVVVGVLAAAIGPLLMVLGGVISGLGALIAVMGAVSAPVVAVVAAIGLVVAAVVLLWNKSEAFRNSVMAVWNAIRSAVQSAIDGIKRKLDENADKIDAFKDGLSKVWQFLQSYVIPAIAKFYEVYLSTLIKVIGFVIEAVIGFVSGLWDFVAAVIDAGKKVFEFGKKVGQAIGTAVEFIEELPGKAVAALSGAGQWLYNTGRDMIQGLINGAGSLLSRIGEFFLDKLPGWIVGPFKAALGISSPSKVFFGFGENTVQGFVDGVRSGKPEVEKAAREDFAKVLTDKVDATMEMLRGRLESARQTFEAFRESVVSSITQAFSFGDAYAAAQEAGITFLDALKQQADGATTFANQIKALVIAGLSPEALQQVLSAGVQAGTAIAKELLLGGSAAIASANDLVTAANTAAETVGKDAATAYHGTGVKIAEDTLGGFKEQFGKGGAGREKLMKVMDSLAEDAARQVRINVEVTRSVNEVVSRITQDVKARASGGPVVAGQSYWVGEKGPELVTFGQSGYVHDAASSARMSAGRSVVIEKGAVQLTVGAGTDESAFRRIVDEALTELARELARS